MKKQVLGLCVLAVSLTGGLSVFAGPAEDFAAAYKDGKFLSAEAAYRELTKANVKVAPVVHFQAAQVADASGQGTLVRDRLYLFLREEKGWNHEVETALWRVLNVSGDVDHFRRLASKAPVSPSLKRVAKDTMKRFVAANRYEQVVQMASAILDVFTDDEGIRRWVVDRIYESRNGNRDGFPYASLKPVFTKHPMPGYDRFNELIWEEQSRKVFDDVWVFEMTAKAKRPVGYVESWLSYLDNDRYSQTTNKVEKQRIKERCEAAKKIEDICMESKNFRLASQYYASALRQPALFFGDTTTNGVSAASAKLFNRLLKVPEGRNEGAWRRERLAFLLGNALNWRRWPAAERAAIIDANSDMVETGWLRDGSSMGNVPEKCDKAKSVKPLNDLCAKFPKRALDLQANQINRYAAAGDKATVERVVSEVIGNSIVSFDAWWAISALNAVKEMSVADKINVLKKGFAKSGWNGGWAEMEKAVKANRGWELPKSKEYAAFIAGLNKTAAAQEPLRRAAWALSQTKEPEKADKIFKEMLAKCPDRMPNGKDSGLDAAFNSALWRYIEIVRNDKPAAKAQFVLTVVPKLSNRYGYMNWVEHVLNGAKSDAAWLAYRKYRFEVFGEKDALSCLYVADKAEKPYEGIDMKVMSPYRNWDYFQTNWNRMKDGEPKFKFLCDWADARPILDNGDVQWISYMLDRFQEYAAREDMAGKIPLKKLMTEVLQSNEPGWTGQRLQVVRIAALCNQRETAVKAFCAFADRLEPIEKVEAYLSLLSSTYHTQRTGWTSCCNWWYDKEKKETHDEFQPILLGKLLPAMKAINTWQAGMIAYKFNTFLDLLQSNCNFYWSGDAKDPAAAAKLAPVHAEFVRLALGGMARRDTEWSYEGPSWARAYDAAIAKSNTVEMARTAHNYSARWSHWIGRDWLKNSMRRSKATGFVEPFYLLVNAFPSDANDGELVSLAARYRAELSSKIPGIYPVGERDPAYPLYVAADELARKNPERAWQLLQDRRNQTVFEREAVKLPPDFVIWGVEQLRMARGDKDALLVKARQIASAILAQESKVSPEVAAAMILSRAEGFRDQQNFEAARLEYQSIRDNPTYHGTKYGKKAMFRAVDLQIATGNAQTVEATLEYWLSQNDREIQAEAHYFMARLAFDRKDYDECIKQLRQVFAISYTHTEGRFLQGQWKLATNSEVDDTDVLVGDLSERNLIRPGNQLTVTVQDANLSVAGGGASIPVIVTTQPGGDEEHINLYPTSRDPSNFKGLVEVQLGKACPSNRVLEVIGSDTVSYVIDPAFLKERGLPLNEPKRLRVIDDAKLAIGAGAPRTEEKKTEKGVKDLLDDESRLNDSGVSARLRPGNPLYVVVRDRDSSMGGQADKVRVTIETSSGDRLENYELQEEKPFSGVFRGKIETSLPPPRAFASDTAAGMNAGDVINKNKSAGWKSLSDGQPGKWFEVDTMGSYLFSEITLDTTSAEDVKAINLVGRMGSKVLNLGRLPTASEASKLYLRRQQQYDRQPRRSLGQMRAFCQTDKAAKPYIVEKIEYRALGNGNDWQSALYKGPCCIPEGVDSLRLRIVPKSAKKDALRNLWITLAVDGDEIFSGQGFKLQNALVTSDITAGCHQFEMAVVSNSHGDDFDLLWEPVGKDPQPLPADWFKEDVHPTLKNFVKDQVQIVKTATGFKAVFEKPVRLRTFRWEFADVKSPDVVVSRISAKDDHGEAILPVASDFSDSQSNGTLEVAPGDRITVKYADERTTTGEKKVLQRDMASSFNDAKVRFIFEEPDEHGNIHAYDAFRFQPGDSLVMSVSDPDCDTTDEADKIEVTIKNRMGKTFTKKLTEYRPKWLGGQEDETYGMHSGIFMGVLKTCHEDNTNAPANVLRVKADDLLTVTYEDRENTDPGVPCTRSVRIFAARSATPQLTLFDVRKTQEVDKSADAKVRLERIRRRPGNENVNVVYRDVLTAEPMDEKVVAATNAIPVNVAAEEIPVRVNDRSLARYACSKVMVEAVAHSEIEKAAAEGRDPDKVTVPLRLAGTLSPFRLTKGDQSVKEATAAGTFNGTIKLSLGPIDPNIEIPENAPPLLCVTGSDLIDLKVLSEDGQPVITRTLKLVSDAKMGLTDSSFSAERNSAHVGESFFVMVEDADRDATDEPDRIEAEVVSAKTGVRRPMTLTETLPHSGRFTGRLRPVMFAPGEAIPSVATGGVVSANEILTEERFAVGYGDRVIFRYTDSLTLPGTPAPQTLSVTGTVFRGANGTVRLFSKRFSDRDAAVLVQFRLAECLFEQAKEHRKLKQPEKSAAAIDEGKFILEEALKNYPDSSHVVQGEYLLANLYQELATEQKDAGNMEKAIPLYQEALSRFSQILGTWPEGTYGARSQYHKALCLEMLQDYNRASEEYVKMTYLYPESDLVGEATIRLATYYYTKEKRYDISGHIYRNFQQRFPQHDKAARSLFMAGSCYIKQAETIADDVEKRKAKKEPVPQDAQARIDGFYRDAVKTFDTLVETYRDGAAKLKAQTLYWAGDVSVRRHDYTKAYQYLKRCVFEFPETEWARRARGLLLQEEKAFKEFQ